MVQYPTPLKPKKAAPQEPQGLGPRQLLWCRQWIRNFADAEGHVTASEEYARKLREKIGEPTG